MFVMRDNNVPQNRSGDTMSYLATTLAASRYASTVKAAHAANVNTPPATFTMPNLSPAGASFDSNGSNPQARRWATAALLTWEIYGLPVGSVWVPCWVGQCDGGAGMFDAWTLDADHIRPGMGGGEGGLLLACPSCNTFVKGSRHLPAPAVAARIDAWLARSGGMVVQGGRNLGGMRDMFYARARRAAGGNWSGLVRYGA